MKVYFMKTGLIAISVLLSAACFGQAGALGKYLEFPDGQAGNGKAIFNGKKPVEVAIQTKDDVVEHVSVAFQDTTAAKVIEEYNQLIDLFREDKNCMNLNMDEEILEGEDLARKMEKGKKYEAHFNYYDPDRNPPLTDALVDKLSDFFTEKQRVRMKELMKKVADAPESQKAVARAEMIDEMRKMGLGEGPDAQPDPAKVFQFMAAFMGGLKDLADGDIWFQIQEFQPPRSKDKEKRFQLVLYYNPKIEEPVK